MNLIRFSPGNLSIQGNARASSGLVTHAVRNVPIWVRKPAPGTHSLTTSEVGHEVRSCEESSPASATACWIVGFSAIVSAVAYYAPQEASIAQDTFVLPICATLGEYRGAPDQQQCKSGVLRTKARASFRHPYAWTGCDSSKQHQASCSSLELFPGKDARSRPGKAATLWNLCDANKSGCRATNPPWLRWRTLLHGTLRTVERIVRVGKLVETMRNSSTPALQLACVPTLTLTFNVFQPS